MPEGHGAEVAGAAEARSAAQPSDVRPKPEARVRALFEDHYDFVWRSLRRLGLASDLADDGAQEVFLVAARRIDQIAPGSERSFLFGTALRVASTLRRTKARRREADVQDEVLEGVPDPAPDAGDLADRRRARALLDEVLEAMPIELRAVFALYELEEFTMIEVSRCLELPQGTVASRLRRAREIFQREVARLRGMTEANR